jgi:hypothetical protein
MIPAQKRGASLRQKMELSRHLLAKKGLQFCSALSSAALQRCFETALDQV